MAGFLTAAAWANPIPLIVGPLLTLGADFGIQPRSDVPILGGWALGAQVQGLSSVTAYNSTVFLHEATVNVSWFHKGLANRGFFFRVQWTPTSFLIRNVDTNESRLDGHFLSRGYGALIGHRWVFDPGVMVGAGMGVVNRYESTPITIVQNVGGGRKEAGLQKDWTLRYEFNVGWVF